MNIFYTHILGSLPILLVQYRHFSTSTYTLFVQYPIFWSSTHTLDSSSVLSLQSLGVSLVPILPFLVLSLFHCSLCDASVPVPSWLVLIKAQSIHTLSLPNVSLSFGPGCLLLFTNLVPLFCPNALGYSFCLNALGYSPISSVSWLKFAPEPIALL